MLAFLDIIAAASASGDLSEPEAADEDESYDEDEAADEDESADEDEA